MVALVQRSKRGGGRIVHFGSYRKRSCPLTPDSDRESGFPQKTMSALRPKVDMCDAAKDVRYGPRADMCGALRAVSGHEQMSHVPLGLNFGA